MTKLEKLEKLEKVCQLMAELGVDDWDVYCYSFAKDLLNRGEEPAEFLAGWQEAESDDPRLLKDLSASISEYSFLLLQKLLADTLGGSNHDPI